MLDASHPNIRPALMEAVMFMIVALLLWFAALPLEHAAGLPGGLGRYQTIMADAGQGAVPALGAFSLPGGLPSLAPYAGQLDTRAQWLQQHAGLALMLIVGGGWLTLTLGRARLGLALRIPLLLLVWSTVGHGLAAWSGRGLAPEVVALAWLSLGGCALLALLHGLVFSRREAPGDWGRAVPWVYPGWVLFGGLGSLWLLDFAARGYPKLRYYGVNQLDWFFLATLVLSLVATLAPQGLAALCRGLTRIESGGMERPTFRSWRQGLADSLRLPIALAGWLALVLVLTWLVLPLLSHEWKPKQHAATIAEALRLPIWVVLAWVGYRWVESGLRVWSGIALGATLLALLVLALWLGKDKGPILAQAVAVALMLSGMCAAWLGGGGLRPRGLMLGSVVLALCLCGIGYLLFLFAPAERLLALFRPHEGNLEFLSEISWLIHKVPAGGFGLGRIPWCGHLASLGAATCAGVPQQVQSDYVLAALIAVLGPTLAALMVALLLAWLGGLVLSQTSHKGRGQVFDLQSLAAWLLACGATTYAAQTAISSLGTLGAIPLTGVSIPLVAYGGASLMTMAVMGGLAANRLDPAGKSLGDSLGRTPSPSH